MNREEILKAASDTITQEPFEFTVDVLPKNKWHQLLQKHKVKPLKKKFVMYPLTIGSAMRISKLFIDVEFTGSINIGAVTEAMSKNATRMAKAIAIAIKNREARPSKSLVRFLLFNLSQKELRVLTKVVITQIGVEDFLTTIILMKGINSLETKKPEEVGPSVPGSQSEDLPDTSI